MKLNEQQLASLSSQKAVYEYLENQRENITNVIKQNLAVGDIFKRENLQVFSKSEIFLYMYYRSSFWVQTCITYLFLLISMVSPSFL